MRTEINGDDVTHRSMIPRDHDFTRWNEVTDQTGHVVSCDLFWKRRPAANDDTRRAKRFLPPFDPVIFDQTELLGGLETGGDVDMPGFSHDGVPLIVSARIN